MVHLLDIGGEAYGSKRVDTESGIPKGSIQIHPIESGIVDSSDSGENDGVVGVLTIIS